VLINTIIFAFNLMIVCTSQCLINPHITATLNLALSCDALKILNID
jgi:hypothetical protein